MINILRKWFGWIEFEQAIYVLMWIFIASVLGLFDYTTWRFDVYKFRDPAYWSEVGLLVGLGVLVFVVSLIRKSKELKENDGETKSIENEIKETIKNTDTSEIREFLVYENKERVKRQYVADKEFELIKLLDNTPDESITIWMSGNEEAIKKDKWCVKRKSLVQQLSEKYIKENYNYLKADVEKIGVGFIVTGVSESKKAKEANENPSNPVRVAIKDNWINFLLPSIFVAALLAFIVTKSDEPRVAILLSISIKMLLLLIQQYSADYYSPVWLAKTWVKDVYFRRDLLLGFLNWKKNKAV